MSKQNKVRIKNTLAEGAEMVQEVQDLIDGKAPENAAGKDLKLIINRIERLEEEKQALSDDIKEVYAEAQGRGYATDILRIVIRRRKKAAEELAQQDSLVELYETAIDGKQLDLFKATKKEEEKNEEERFDPQTGEVIEDEEPEEDDDEDDFEDDFED